MLCILNWCGKASTSKQVFNLFMGCNMKKFAKMALAAAIAGLGFAAHAGLVIDDFSVNQAVLPSTLIDSTADGVGLYNSVTGPVANILGGERDLFIDNLTTDGFGAEVGVNVSGGLLKYSTDTGASGRSILKWDGMNGSSAVTTGSEGAFMGTLNPIGLSNLNLAANGSQFLIRVKESDLGFDFSMTVFTDSTRWTTLVLQSAAHHNFLPASGGIDFADFLGGANEINNVLSSGALRFTGVGGSADMSNVGALLATVNWSGGPAEIDLQIGDVGAVPEPESLALVGLGLLGLAVTRRRKIAA